MDLSHLDRDRKEQYLKLLQAKNIRIKQNKITQYYPDDGPLSRDCYPKHMQFFAAGADFSERCIMAANRIGKALKHGTKVATPYGWKKIEDITLGDSLIVNNSDIAPVKAIYPQGIKPTFEIKFSIGKSIICCADHLWKYKKTPTDHWQIDNTQKLISLIQEGFQIIIPYWPLDNEGMHLPLAHILTGTKISENCSILDIVPSEDFECTCIEVDHPEHLFVIEHGIVTHNSEGIGAYETTLHATGRYPAWWTGKRFTKPVSIWACGTTSTTARDIVQYKLIGNPEEYGTGLIPEKYIIKTSPKAGGVANAIDMILVKHISGGISRIKIKSYAEGRKSFEGTEQDLIWLDEECPLPIYTECITRTMTTNGLIMLTFTPLEGLTDTVLQFMPNGKIEDNQEGSKFLIQATWDDAPHLTKEQKDKLWAALPPHQRDARSKGVPQLGSGAIYPILESNITVADFAIPDHWLRCYALDVGWKKTATVWAATDPTSNITYLYSEYYQGQQLPLIHADAIKARGNWIPGVVDSAAHGRSQDDGKQLFEQYFGLGLDLENANKSVEAGLYAVWQMLSTNRLKVFGSLVNWFSEFRIYRRDENGQIVKDRDHLMDCTRYLIMSGLKRAIAKPYWEFQAWEESELYNHQEASLVTGY